MDEELQGGLNAVTKPQPIEVPVDQEPSKESLFKDDSLERLRNERLVYDKHLQKMIAALASRENRPTLDRELAVLGAELGESPYFATGFGKGVAKMADVRDLDQQKKLEDLKTTADILKLKEGLAKEDYLLSEELKGQKYLRDMAAKRLGKSPNQLAVTDISGKPTARQILSGGLGVGYGSGPNGLITQDDIMLAPPSAQKRIIEDYKRQQEDIKILQEGAKSVEVDLPFLGTRKISNQREREVETIVNSPQYRALPKEAKMALMQQYYADAGIGEVEYPSTTQGEKPSMETTSQKEIRLKGEGKTAEQRSEKNVTREQNFFNAADTAQQRRISADNVERIAISNPKFFNTLQKPNVVAALGRLVSSGVQTPYGPINIDLKDASAAAGNLLDDIGVTSLLGLNKTDIKTTDREAYALFLRDLAIMQVAQRRSSNPVGQGSISDYEQRLFASTTFMKEDDSRVQQLKAKMIKMQAKMDEDLAELLTNWQEKNPNKPVTNFLYTSPEFKQFKKSHENKLEKLRNQNADLFGQVSQINTEDTEIAPTSSSNYASIIQQEKERRKLR